MGYNKKNEQLVTIHTVPMGTAQIAPLFYNCSDLGFLILLLPLSPYQPQRALSLLVNLFVLDGVGLAGIYQCGDLVS